ncbi:MAG TPA: transposase, partial [Polyangiaceae bacterium]|nr:transposase [Polyangiaceae bacterium]
ARELRPLYAAARALVRAALDVHADETSFRQLGRDKKSYFWDFVTPELIVYCYATDRSGDTPEAVLGDSQGRLVVDQHTGYNVVTKPGKRTRGSTTRTETRSTAGSSSTTAASCASTIESCIPGCPSSRGSRGTWEFRFATGPTAVGSR